MGKSPAQAEKPLRKRKIRVVATKVDQETYEAIMLASQGRPSPWVRKAIDEKLERM